MGLNVASVYSYNAPKSIIDVQALEKVAEKILNPNSEQSIDVSKLDFSKFNRVNIGTDLYSPRTNGEMALQVAKSNTDFGLNLSQNFNANIQYLNSQAAQSLFTEKENNGKVFIPVDGLQKVNEQEIVLASSQVTETKDTNKDKKGSNPFSFYANVEKEEESEDADYKLNSINIFA